MSTHSTFVFWRLGLRRLSCLVLTLLVIGEPVKAAITVTSPSGGEVYLRDTTSTFRWNSDDGGNVRIEWITPATGGVSVLAASAPNTGSYNFTWGDWVTPSEGNFLRITSVSNPSSTDTSDGEFMLSTAAYERVVVLKASASAGPSASITLNWPAWPTKTLQGWEICRKTPDQQNWGAVMASLPKGAKTWTDNTVQPGVVYEYRILKNDPSVGPAYGYIYSGIDVPLPEDRGRVLLLVDQAYAGPLSGELSRCVMDLAGDGWEVVRRDIAPDQEPEDVKKVIRSVYDEAPTRLRAVYIFGRVAIPMSGRYAPDGHAARAIPADMYYGDMALPGGWTDTATTSGKVAGDGVFDQDSAPGPLTLQVGRVDLAGMPMFPMNSSELHRQYLAKTHSYRFKTLTAPSRALVDDIWGGTFPKAGWRSWGTLADRITAGDWNTVLPTNAYTFGYGSGGGSYTSADGVATTKNFADLSHRVLFTMLFGSYFVEFQKDNVLLRAPLATAYGLTCVWSGFRQWLFHPMGMGMTTGYSHLLSQNAPVNVYDTGETTVKPYMALMGDPTLRLHVIAPPSSALRNGHQISWSPSPDASVSEYRVYRSELETGPYTRIAKVPATVFSVVDAGGGANNFYMVRAVKREISPTGTYENASQGVFSMSGYLRIAPGTSEKPRVAFGKSLGFAATCYDSGFNKLASQPSVAWSVSGGGTIDTNGVFTAGRQPGNFTITATAGEWSDSVTLFVGAHPAEHEVLNDRFDYTSWNAGLNPMNAKWSPIGASPGPGFGEYGGDRYAQLNNAVFTRGLDLDLTEDFDLTADVMHPTYSRALWIGLFNSEGTNGYGAMWDSSLSTLNDGCGVVSIRKFTTSGLSSLAFNTGGTLLGSVQNSGHRVNTLPFAKLRLTWRKATGQLKLYMDGRLMENVRGENAYSQFSRICFGGGTDAQFSNIRVTCKPSLKTWRLGNNLPEDGIGALDADPDCDGVCNLLEYAFGSDPNSGESGMEAGPEISLNENKELSLAFYQHCADLTYTVEGSVDLKSWVPLATNLGSSDGKVSYNDGNQASQARYLRLRISHPSYSAATEAAGRLDVELRQGRENAVAFPLERIFTGAFQGKRAGLITGLSSSTLTCTGANWTPGVLSRPDAPWFLRITSGAAKGTLVQVSLSDANTDNRVSLLPGEQNLTALGIQPGVDSFELIPAHTLNSLFPLGSLQGGSVTEADQVRVWNGTAWLTYYHDGTQWLRGEAGSAGNTVLRPDQGCVIVRRGATKSLPLLGKLGGAGLRVFTPAGKKSFIATTPRPVTFAEAALQLLPGWKVEPAFPTIGDHVQIWTGTVWQTYYFDGSIWRRQGAGSADAASLFSPGRPVMINRPAAAAPLSIPSSP